MIYSVSYNEWYEEPFITYSKSKALNLNLQ